MVGDRDAGSPAQGTVGAPPQPEALAFALISVASATRAGAEHGDARALEHLVGFYAICAEAIGQQHGRIVKTLGDGLLATFPPETIRDVAATLRELQSAGTTYWQAYDARCRVQIKLGLGTVLAGHFGPPGQEIFDVYGNALSQLFKLPSGDFVLSAAAAQYLGP